MSDLDQKRKDSKLAQDDPVDDEFSGATELFGAVSASQGATLTSSQGLPLVFTSSGAAQKSPGVRRIEAIARGSESQPL